MIRIVVINHYQHPYQQHHHLPDHKISLQKMISHTSNVQNEIVSDASVTESVAEAVEKTVEEVVENITDLSESKYNG